MADETTQTVTDTTTTTTKDAAYWEAEAKKAFETRQATKRELDEVRKRLQALDGVDPDEYKTLKSEREKAEEEKKRKAGEFDSWRADILKKHQSEIQARDEKVTVAQQKWQRTMVGLAFAGASDLFGKDAFTIYSPKAAERIFSEFVTLDDDGNAVVKDRGGNVILDADTGKPASFSVAMRELIESLPDRNDHLRGSGKTGSGSTGGGQPGSPADLTELTQRARTGDKDAITALRQRRAASGSLVMGTAFNSR
jgi:hypothetical protein